MQRPWRTDWGENVAAFAYENFKFESDLWQKQNPREELYETFETLGLAVA